MTDTEDEMAEAAFWNDAAEKYAEKPVKDPNAFDRKIAITKSRMRPSDVVLDIGCGTGSLALRLAPDAARVHGLDVSREMLRIANSKAAQQGVGNVSFHVGPFDDTFELFDPGSLDGICAYSILHLLEDRRGALDRIYELLRPGGFFVSSTVVLGDTWVPYGPMLTVMKWLGKAPDVWIFSTEQLVAEMRAAGFVDVEVRDVGAKEEVAFVTATRPG